MAPLRAQLASGNAHKLDELRAALPGWEIELVRADAFPAEDGETYYENARGKALFGREVGEPDAWILGEDSGSRRQRSAAGPESSLRGGPGTVSRSFLPSWTVQPTAAPATSASSSPWRRTAASRVGPGSSRGRSRASAAATKASATTRSSSRRARRAPSPSSGTTGSAPTHTAPAPQRTFSGPSPSRPDPTCPGSEPRHVRVGRVLSCFPCNRRQRRGRFGHDGV